MVAKLKLKPCRICKNKFMPVRAIQPTCSYDCSVTYAMASLEKKKRLETRKTKRETKQRLDKLKTRQEHLKDAQRFFNQYIRLRDQSLPCISCSRHHSGQYHAGHYRTVGSSPHLRFNESNCHKQCAPCNNHLSGNIINFRAGLIARYGLGYVDEIESENEPKHYTIDEIKAIKVKYKQLTKELKDAKE
jgi:hypothetical protein